MKSNQRVQTQKTNTKIRNLLNIFTELITQEPGRNLLLSNKEKFKLSDTGNNNMDRTW